MYMTYMTLIIHECLGRQGKTIKARTTQPDKQVNSNLCRCPHFTWSEAIFVYFQEVHCLKSVFDMMMHIPI